MADDIALLRKASGILKLAAGTEGILDLGTILDELWRTSQEEMNFRKEAAHLETFRKTKKTSNTPPARKYTKILPRPSCLSWNISTASGSTIAAH